MPILPGLIANSGGSQPTPPTGLFSSATTVSSFTLNWTPPDFLGKLTPIRYVVSLYDSSGSLLNSSHKTANYPATSVVVDGLAEGTTYSVRMRLENSSGIFSALSAPSANITTAVTPPPPPPQPAEPTWYCSQNAVGNGASFFTSSTNESISRCDSYAIACSTSGYPGTPSIPSCPVDPPPDPGPTPTCANSCGAYGPYGSCQTGGGYYGAQYSTRTCSISGCTTTRSRSCCIAYCGPWGLWINDRGGQYRNRSCLAADCSTYNESQVRCNVRSTTNCTSCTTRRPYRRTCTTTTTNSDCSQTSTSSTQSC